MTAGFSSFCKVFTFVLNYDIIDLEIKKELIKWLTL